MLRSMIKSFFNKSTEAIFNGKRAPRIPFEIQRRALNKLRIIDNISQLEELRIPPSNRLEALKGDREGQHSIRINDQWRICLRWADGNAHQVEITDYH
jgi:proteic killer suppression protein